MTLSKLTRALYSHGLYAGQREIGTTWNLSAKTDDLLEPDESYDL
jgi:hypothetical protein